MTEGGRPAHRRERGKYPLRGNLHTEGGLQRDLHAKRRGDYPLRGNLHKQGGDNPAQKAREVCKQRKRHTCQTKETKHQHKKGREDLNKGKGTYSGGKGPGQRENYTGDAKPAHKRGILELKTCKLRGEYTHTQNTRYLNDLAETEQHQNHTLTPNTGREAKYLIDFAEIEQQQNHTRTHNTRWGLDI